MAKGSVARFISRNKWHVLILIALFGVGVYLYQTVKIDTLPTNGEHYNILTINTVFAGFMYSLLGTMIEFNSRKRIQELDKAGYMDAYYSSVYIGLFFFISSIALGLLGAFITLFSGNKIMFFFEILFMFYGFIYFIISAFGLMRLLHKIRNNIEE